MELGVLLLIQNIKNQDLLAVILEFLSFQRGALER
jgi:hypothetical protein